MGMNELEFEKTKLEILKLQNESIKLQKEAEKLDEEKNKDVLNDISSNDIFRLIQQNITGKI